MSQHDEEYKFSIDEPENTFVMSWNDMGKRVLRPLEIKSKINLVMLIGSFACMYFTKNVILIGSLMLSNFVYIGFFVYYRKRIEKVKKLIYQWGAADVYKHFYPEEYKQKFERVKENVIIENNDRSRIKNRLSQIEEIAKKYQNE
jgi:hypothetical protein